MENAERKKEVKHIKKNKSVFSDIKFVAKLKTSITVNKAIRADLFAKYDFLCQAIENKSCMPIIESNKEIYKILCNKQTVLTVMYGATVAEIATFTNLNKQYVKIVNQLGTNTPHKVGYSLYKLFSGALINLVNVKVESGITYTNLIAGLSSFGLPDIPEDMLDTEEMQEALKDSEVVVDSSISDVFDNISSDNIMDMFGAGQDEEEPIESIEEPIESIEEPIESIEEPIDNIEEPIDNIEEQVEDEDIEKVLNEDVSNTEDNVDDATEQDKKEDKSEDDKADSFNERKNKYAYISENIDSFVENSFKTIRTLYISGFTGLPQDGILCRDQMRINSNGGSLFRLDRATGKLQIHKDANVQDDQILDAVCSQYATLSNFLDPQDNDILPSIADLTGKSGVCYTLHLAFQTANIKSCKGLISIRKFITEKCGSGSEKAHEEWLNKHNSGNKSSLRSTKVVEDWYKWALERIYYNVVMETYPNVEDTHGKGDEILDLLCAVEKNILNVIVVPEKRRKVNTEIRIAVPSISSSTIDKNTSKPILEAIESKFRGKAKAEWVAENTIENHVLDINIIFDEAKANTSDLFASDVIDSIIESGVVPSWKHCLMGKQPDGQLYFYDKFNTQKNRDATTCSYAIYAGSGSGKGVMTSTLIASALCDDVQVFYTDGKPDNGAVIGRIAWEQGVDTYVFDGKPNGQGAFSNQMETHTWYIDGNEKKYVRSIELISNTLEKMPTTLFKSSNYFGDVDSYRAFAGVMRYLKSINLFVRILRARSKQVLPMDKNQFWIFDELEGMSSLECDVRKTFVKYIADVYHIQVKESELTQSKKLAELISKDKLTDKSSDKYDPGIEYISNFVKFTNMTLANWGQAITADLRLANLEVLFIFQNAQWLQPDTKHVGTCIRNFVMQAKCTKIVGKGALANNCGQYGDGNTSKCDWYTNYVNTDKAYWAISENPDINRNHEVQLFKPFKVFTIPYDTSTNVLYTPEQVAAYERKAQDKGEKYVEKFFAGYVKKLASHFNIDIVSLLHSTHEYASNAIVELKLSDKADINNYIYDCSELGLGEYSELTKEDLDEVQKTLENQRTIRIDEEDASSINTGNINTGNIINTDNINTGNIINTGSSASDSIIDSSMPSRDIFDTPVDTTNLNISDPKVTNMLKAYKPYAIELLGQNSNLVKFLGNAKMLKGQNLIASGYSPEQLAIYNSKFNIYGTVLNNAFDYTTRQVRNDKNQLALKTASVYLSNLWIIGKLNRVAMREDTATDEVWVTYNSILEQLRSKIGSREDADNRYKLAVGMLEDYDREQLAFDEMPTLDQLRGYISKYASQELNNAFNSLFNTDVNVDFFGDVKPGAFDYNDQPQEDTGHVEKWENTPEFETTVDESCYNIFDSIINLIKPRPTQEIVKKSKNIIAVEAPKFGKTYGFKKKLFETVKGSSYAFKAYWDAIIKAIKKGFPDSSLVTNIVITDTAIIANKKAVDVSNIIGGEYDIQMEDIVVIKDLFANFKGLKVLQICKSLRQNIMYEYGDYKTPENERIALMFQEHTSLKRLIFLSETGNARDNLVVPREALLTSASVINKTMGLERLNMQIDQMAAKNDTKLHKKSPGVVSRIWKRGMAISGDQFVRANELLDEKAGKAFGRAGLGALAFGLTLGASAVTGTVSGAGKVINLFRKNK